MSRSRLRSPAFPLISAAKAARTHWHLKHNEENLFHRTSLQQRFNPLKPKCEHLAAIRRPRRKQSPPSRNADCRVSRPTRSVVHGARLGHTGATDY